jgi:predicted dehydrogenase
MVSPSKSLAAVIGATG